MGCMNTYVNEQVWGGEGGNVIHVFSVSSISDGLGRMKGMGIFTFSTVDNVK